MNKSEKNLITNIFMVFLAEIVPTIVNFVSLPIFTNTLYFSENNYGLYDLLGSIISVMLPICTLQIGTAVFKKIIDAESNENRATIISSGMLFLIIVSFALLVGITAIPFAEFSTRILFIAWYLFKQMETYFRFIARGLGKYNIYAKSIALESSCNLLFFLVLVWQFHTELPGAIGSIIIGEIACTIYLYKALQLRPYCRIKNSNAATIANLLRFSLPLIPNAISLWIIKLSDRIIISAFLGTSHTALYAVINKVPSVYSGIISVFNTAWLESASKNNSHAYWQKIYNEYCNILVALTLCSIAGTPIFFALFVNESYYDAMRYIPILIIGIFFSGLASFQAGILFAVEKTKTIGISTVMSAISNTLINILFIKKWGLYAAVFSTLISYLATFIFRKISLQSIPIPLTISNMRKTAMTICIAIVTLLFYQSHIALAVAAAIVFSILFCYRLLKNFYITARTYIKKR